MKECDELVAGRMAERHAMRYHLVIGGEALHNPHRSMTNAQINYSFFRSASQQVRESILADVCMRYSINRSEAQDEIFAPEAEHLLDYLTGPVRSATHVLMQRAGLA